MSEELPQISTDFIEENYAKLCQKKRGGPYTRKDKQTRRNEVYRLHFDYGYSARNISELMNINRNTINSDIDYWYSRIANIAYQPEMTVFTIKERLENQRVRLRELLDSASTVSEKLAIEKMITDIDTKLANIHLRIVDAMWRVHENGINMLNEHLEDIKSNERFMLYYDRIKVSSKTHKKIEEIINKDRKTVS
ncbi:MAG: DUF4349 domain-containing protein [Candidatus Nitrosotenuis sp.]|nr:DUF4349 domain-containing protein [Candidatus Nitrosotenuis sp.]